jgi:hypothetical protein
MAKQKLEIECPVCDAKLSIDARSCPKCGADLGMSDFQDLENLANDISNGKAFVEEPQDRTLGKEVDSGPVTKTEGAVVPPQESPKPEDIEPRKGSEPKVEASPGEALHEDEPLKAVVKEEKAEVQADPGKKKGLFSKLFGKKK